MNSNVNEHVFLFPVPKIKLPVTSLSDIVVNDDYKLLVVRKSSHHLLLQVHNSLNINAVGELGFVQGCRPSQNAEPYAQSSLLIKGPPSEKGVGDSRMKKLRTPKVNISTLFNRSTVTPISVSPTQ